MSAVTLTSPVANPKIQTNGEALYEVVNGERVELPAMSIYAAWIASRLHGILWPFVEKGALGTGPNPTIATLPRRYEFVFDCAKVAAAPNNPPVAAPLTSYSVGK